jgi:predicted DNA-binding transcriptional regulator YafY
VEDHPDPGCIQTGKTVADLADRLGCTPRTVYRDLDALQAGGFPITTETRDNRSYWLILNANRQRVPQAFSIPELMALYFGKDMLKTYRGTVFYRRHRFPAVQDQRHAAGGIHRLPGPDPQPGGCRSGPPKGLYPVWPIITELNRAIIEEKKVRMAYLSMGSKTQSRRTVHPYRLRHVEDTLYLIGYCELRKGVRTFAVDRIQTAAVTDEEFDIPEAFDVQAFLQDSFGIFLGPPVTVEIRFLKSVAGYIRERIWHPSQQLSEAADGALIFTATVAGIEEISHWILRWGAGAQVLAPEALRRTVSRHAAAMAAYYQDEPVEDGQAKP